MESGIAQRAIAEREQVEVNLEKLLVTLAFDTRPCKQCGVKLFIICYRKAGERESTLAYVNHDGSFHAFTCTKKGPA